MTDWLADYKKHLEARHLAAATIEQRIKMLEAFHEWLSPRDLATSI